MASIINPQYDFTRKAYVLVKVLPVDPQNGGYRASIQRKKGSNGPFVVAKTFYLNEMEVTNNVYEELRLYNEYLTRDPNHSCPDNECVHQMMDGVIRCERKIPGTVSHEFTLMLEYCEGGEVKELMEFAKRKQRGLPEPLLWHLFREFILRILDCHDRKVTYDRWRTPQFALQLASLRDPFRPNWQPIVKLCNFRESEKGQLRPSQFVLLAGDLHGVSELMRSLIWPTDAPEPKKRPDPDLVRWIRKCFRSSHRDALTFREHPEWNETVTQQGFVKEIDLKKDFLPLSQSKIDSFTEKDWPRWMDNYFERKRDNYLKRRIKGWEAVEDSQEGWEDLEDPPEDELGEKKQITVKDALALPPATEPILPPLRDDKKPPTKPRGPPRESQQLKLSVITRPLIRDTERIQAYEDIFGINTAERFSSKWTTLDPEQMLGAFRFFHARTGSVIGAVQARLDIESDENGALIRQLRRQLLSWLRLKQDLNARISKEIDRRCKRLVEGTMPEIDRAERSPRSQPSTKGSAFSRTFSINR
ncbi:MAG: hypothetical protein MMC23_003102 [Stictis urceolatum]|nr:hypothetical protein [Stictis urceolata]